MLHRQLPTLSLFLVACATLAAACAAEKGRPPRVQFTTLTNRVRVEIDGQLFTEYYFRDVPRPFCYPLLGPGGVPMTRNWPMKEVGDEDRDHPHHRSLWYAHGAVNGHDFWSEKKGFGKIVHDAFLEVTPGNESGVLRTRNQWVAADGTVVCTDERTLRIYAGPAHVRLFDFDITLYAGDKALLLGDTKEGTMAVRVAETMRLKGKVGRGRIVTSTGLRDGEAWGKRADWVDYYGPVNDQIVGIAIFDHPQNPRHPTWWHVRDYGLFAANPFGQHDFERLADQTAGDLRVPAGQSVTFRYRFYLHQGDEIQGRVADRYRAYVVATTKPK